MAAGILPSIIYPDTARQAANRLLQAASGTDQSVQQCASIDAGTRASWGQFYAALVQFAKQDPGIFGLGTRMDRIEAYATEIEGPDTYAFFISVAQTSPSTRITLASALPATQAALSPEDQFLNNVLQLGGAGAIYWRVGVSLMVEIDSVVSEVRSRIGGEAWEQAT